MLHACIYAQSWNLTGNTGASSVTNFIGTKDNQALVFKVNNIERMRILTNGNTGIGTNNSLQKLDVAGNINIGSGFALFMENHLVFTVDSVKANIFLGNGVASRNTGNYNTATGYQALNANTSGTHNTATGFNALHSNTTGWFNMATGSAALYHNTSGNQNIASGYEALYTNTTGSSNIAIGHYALALNSTGAFNTATGDHALFSNTTGIQNMANGASALYSNTTGSYNTASGRSALYYNTIGTGNTAYGGSTLYSNTTGTGNTANGGSALYNNTTGSKNTASGTSALYYNTTGTDNIANGYQALLQNISGTANTALGNYSLFLNTRGSFNTATGISALNNNTTGNNNTAIGASALYNNTTGYYNIATGDHALYSNTTGSQNTANGISALYGNTTGWANIATGYQALYSNTSGIYNNSTGYQALFSNTTGKYNIADGSYALQKSTSGTDNTGIGYFALNENTTGDYNTAVGSGALIDNNDSWYNTAIGYHAGDNYLGHNGWNNTFLGSLTTAHYDGTYNSTAIGNFVIVYASNQVRIGNNFVTSIGGPVNWTSLSDGRVKKNIKQNVPGLAFINKLKPVTYNLDLDAADKIHQTAAINNEDGKMLTQKTSEAEIKARTAKQQIVYTGFVAQDVEKAAKELNYDFSGVDAAKSDKDLYGLRYAEFVVPLVKAVQELSKDNDDLKSTLSNMVAQVAELKNQITLLKNTKSSPGIPQPSSDPGRLEQNVPNPFNRATSINYYIPSSASRAALVISNVSGQTLKNISLNNRGIGKTSISAGDLAAGEYFYTLFIDGRKIDTKQMLLTR